MSVAVHEITNGGYTGPRWLCPEHVEERKAAKWTVKVGMPLPDGSLCDDCLRVTQEAPGYTTPTVDYVPTTEVRPLSIALKKRKPLTAPVGMFDESEAA